MSACGVLVIKGLGNVEGVDIVGLGDLQKLVPPWHCFYIFFPLTLKLTTAGFGGMTSPSDMIVVVSVVN